MVVLWPCSGPIWTRPGLGSGEVVLRPRSRRRWRMVWLQVVVDWLGLLEVETSQEKSSFWPWSEPAMATPVGAAHFLGSIVEGYSPRRGLGSGGKLLILGIGRWRCLCVFLLVGGIVPELASIWGLVDGWV